MLIREFGPNPRLVGLCLLPLVSVVLASPVISSWLIGDLSANTDSRLDYLIEPPELTDSSVDAIRLIVVGVGFCGLAAGMWLFQQSLLSARQILATTPLVAAGLYAGFAYRVLTAGYTGAHQGAGLVMIGTLIFLPIKVWASALILRTEDEKQLPPGHEH